MDKWQQEFSSRVSVLRDRWAKEFDNWASHQLVPVFKDFSDFATRCEMHATAAKDQKGVRSFKFALTEDAYALISFRSAGVDSVEFDYECWLPSQGRIAGVKSDITGHQAERHWVESCFRMALDDLVSKFANLAGVHHAEEMAVA